MKSEVELTPELLQANPGLALLLTLFSLLVVALLAGCLSMWIWAVVRWVGGKPVLVVEPWRPRSWGLLDLVLTGFLVLSSQVIGFKIWADANGIKLSQLKDQETDTLTAMAVGSLTLLAAMVMTMGWLLLRYSATLDHIGFSLRRLWQRIALGMGAATMWLPIVLLIMAGVSLAFGREYDHPLINKLTEDGTLSSYLLAVFCAVVAAPLVEEFLFRVMLQGWLQSIPFTLGSLWWLLGANREQSRSVMTEAHADVIEAEVMSDQPPRLIAPDPNPYASGLAMPEATLEPVGPSALPADLKPPIWPVFVAGTLFGLAHYDYGVSFVPLIVLGIVLGLLYRATHSIWPSFVLHFALNAFSMGGVGLGLLMESVK